MNLPSEEKIELAYLIWKSVPPSDSDLRYPCTQGTEAFLLDNSSAEHSQPFVKIVKELLVAAAAAAAAAAAPRSLPIR